MDIGFDEWFDIFTKECNKLGYKGPFFDKDAFEWDWEEGSTPESTAIIFVEQMNN